MVRTEAMRELGSALCAPALTRCDFLRRAAGAGAAAALLARSDLGGAAPPRARIAIVGAGIAGLTAALTLADRRVPATVFEASIRLGGRANEIRSALGRA